MRVAAHVANPTTLFEECSPQGGGEGRAAGIAGQIPCFLRNLFQAPRPANSSLPSEEREEAPYPQPSWLLTGPDS